jgi:hypothetical protein
MVLGSHFTPIYLKNPNMEEEVGTGKTLFLLHCFSESGSSILAEYLPIRIRIQGFDDQKLRKKMYRYSGKKFKYFFLNLKN